MAEQYELFGGVPPHVRGSDTSLGAAVSVKERAATLRGNILDIIRKAQHGMTCDAVEHVTGWPHQTVSARIRELVLLGQVKDSGERRLTRSGRRARVYRRHDNADNND